MINDHTHITQPSNLSILKSYSMKKIAIVFCFTLAGVVQLNNVIAQDFKKIVEIEYEKKEDYKPHEAEMLLCANYILQHPADKDNVDRLVALQAIIKWMSGTPDYKFSIDESITSLSKKNDDVLGIYMAALTKFVLENPDQSKNQSAIKLNAFTYLLDYCVQSSNKIKRTKEISKAIDAKNNNSLKEYLSIK